MLVPSRGRQPKWAPWLWPSAVIALAWFPVAQVFANSQLPCSDSGLTYLLRAVQLHLNVLGGRPFLTWAPELMHGFGYPIFGFYAPLSTWLLEMGHLAGVDFALATRLAFAGSLLAAGLGVLALVGDDFGPVAGSVAGVAFMYAPYLLFDAIQRGGLPELMAFAAAPWALWLARRAAAEFASGVSHHRAILASLFAVAALAIVVLSHNMVPIWLSPLIVVACLMPGVGSQRQAWRRAGLAIAVVLAAMLVTAFFWLPALAEIKWAQTWLALAVHNQDYRNNLLPIDQWLTLPPLPIDPTGLLNPPIVRTMGIVAAAAALGGLLLSYRLSRTQRWACWVYAAMLVTCFGLSTEWARPIWDHVPGMKWFQLPTRFLGLASLGAAGLSGALVAQFSRWPVRGALFAGGLATALMLNGLPWTYTPYCATPLNATVLDITRNTRFPDLMTAEGSPEFLPIWVQALPDDKAFVADLAAGRAPSRFDLSRLPASSSARAVTVEPAAATWEIDGPTPWTALYRSYYFPGWSATVDGQPAQIQVTAPNGLMEVAVPAGHHILTIKFGATPIRAIAAVMSLLSIMGLVGMWLVARLRHKSSPTPVSTNTSSVGPKAFTSPNPRGAAWLFGVILLAVTAKWAYLDHVPNPLHAARLSGDGLAGVSHATGIDFGGQVRHLGYDLAGAPVPSGGTLILTQYWTPLVKIGVPYGMAARLTDDAGHVWNMSADRPFGYTDYPGTESWPLGAYARDGYQLKIMPGAPPGNYWLETSAFRRDVQLSLIPTSGTPTGGDPAWARLGQVQVLASSTPASAARGTVDVYQPIELTDGLTLLGWSLPMTTLSPGDQAHVQLLWLARSEIRPTLTGNGRVIAPDGSVMASFPFSLGGEQYPTPLWSPGEVVRDQLDWQLPAGLPTGTYEFEAAIRGAAGVSLGKLQVRAPDRLFTPPPVARAVTVQMGFARLLGLQKDEAEARAGQTLPVDLVWQATSLTSTSYRVFVHLRDAAGNIRSQADSIPNNWTRPTTSWLPGEYLVDHHDLALSPNIAPGSYDLFVGLYDPATGQRLGEASLGMVIIE